MKPNRFYEILGIDQKGQDLLAQADKIFASAGIYVRSKSPDRTIYTAVTEGRASKNLDNLAEKGLFSVSLEDNVKTYTPTKKFVDVWRTYQELKSR